MGRMFLARIETLLIGVVLGAQRTETGMSSVCVCLCACMCVCLGPNPLSSAHHPSPHASYLAIAF